MTFVERMEEIVRIYDLEIAIPYWKDRDERERSEVGKVADLIEEGIIKFGARGTA